MKKSFLFLSALMMSSTLYAGKVTVVGEKKFDISNTGCETTDSCDLLSAQGTIRSVKVDLSDNKNPSMLTSFYFKYKTTNIESLRKYGVVQFMRGCRFVSRQLENGDVVKNEFTVKRSFFGKRVVNHFPDWVIDSDDVDPMYNSTTPEEFVLYKNRHAFYRFNTDPNGWGEKTEKYFGEATPIRPELYVWDAPSTTFYEGENKAQSSTLEFKTCLYKIEDIPLVSTPTGMSLDKALLCVDWKSNWVYDFATKTISNPEELDDFCVQPSR